MSTMGEAASTADDLGSVDPDVAPGAEPLVNSSPGTTAAAAADACCWCGGCVCSYCNREGTRDPLKHLCSARSLSEHHVWNNTNGYVHEYLRLCGRDSANCSDSVLHT